MCTQGSGGFCGAAWQAAADCQSARCRVGTGEGREPSAGPAGGGSQPPRRLPACPTSRQRFHFYVVHPGGRVQPPCSEFHTIIAVSAIITTLVVPAITDRKS